MRKASLSQCPESQSLIDELNNAAAKRDDQQHLKILERVADLFAAGSRGYSGAQIAVFDDVLRMLCAEVEVEARARLAERLAHVDCAPPKLLRLLAFDDAIAVAEPVLAHSQQLTDGDLVENARAKSQEHLLAIARRLKLSEAVTDVLVERGDRRVVHRVVRNKGARFSLAGYASLTKRARRSEKLAMALAQRGDIPRQCFLKLLETASAAVRAELESANPRAAGVIRDAVDEVATNVQRDVRKASRRFAVTLRDANRLFNVQPFTEANIHAPAHGQDFERTAIALAKLGRFPVDLVERALLDKGEDMILVLAKAAGCSWTTAKELLLMHAAERNLGREDLARFLESYQKLSQPMARNAVDLYERRLKQRVDEPQAPAQPREKRPALG
jgi:uncharacterized protein (DUF2336 family)